MDKRLSHRGGTHSETYLARVNQKAPTAQRDCQPLCSFHTEKKRCPFSLCGCVRAHQPPNTPVPSTVPVALSPSADVLEGDRDTVWLVAAGSRQSQPAAWPLDRNQSRRESPLSVSTSGSLASVPLRAKYEVRLALHGNWPPSRPGERQTSQRRSSLTLVNTRCSPPSTGHLLVQVERLRSSRCCQKSFLCPLINPNPIWSMNNNEKKNSALRGLSYISQVEH